MTSVVMPPNTYGLDAASFRAVTNFEPVRAAGAQWVSLYIGGTYGVSARTIEAAWAAGLPVMPNFERDAKAALGGYTTGQLHATTATTQLTALGFEGECPVVFSGVDFGPSAGQFAALDAYHHALVDTLEPHGWTGGAYGPRSYLAHLDGAAWWPDGWPLWHWGGDGFTIYDWAWCKQWYGYDQTPVKSSTLGYAVDENTLFKPMKFWSGYGADNGLIPEEDDMTEAELRAIVDPQFKAIWDVLTAPGPVVDGFGNPLSMQWCNYYGADAILYKSDYVNRIAAAVVAALPPAAAGSAPSVEAIADELARRLAQDA